MFILCSHRLVRCEGRPRNAASRERDAVLASAIRNSRQRPPEQPVRGGEKRESGQIPRVARRKTRTHAHDARPSGEIRNTAPFGAPFPRIGDGKEIEERANPRARERTGADPALPSFMRQNGSRLFGLSRDDGGECGRNREIIGSAILAKTNPIGPLTGSAPPPPAPQPG